MAAWPYGEHQAWPLPRTGRHRADDHGRHRAQTLARNLRPHRALGVLAVAVTSVAVLIGAVAGTGTSAAAGPAHYASTPAASSCGPTPDDTTGETP